MYTRFRRPSLLAIPWLLAGALCVPGAASGSAENPETNFEWAEYHRNGFFQGMPALYYQDNFKEVFNAIVPIGAGATCESAVLGSVGGDPLEGILAQLNKLRKEHPEMLEGLSYGPVHIDSWMPDMVSMDHHGVVIYPTPRPGETWEDTISRGIVIEQTNYISDDTGHYLLRPYEDWETPKVAGVTIGVGKPYSPYAEGQEPPYYWDEDETYPDPPCDPATEECGDEGGGGGGGSPALDPDDDHGGPTREKRRDVAAVASRDPNEKQGVAGVGPERWIVGTERLTYVVAFENVGSGPAQVVTVEDRLDLAHLDLATFELGPIGFSDTEVPVPMGSTVRDVVLDLRPGRDLLVRVRAELDAPAGVVRWTFESIDPATWALPPLDGFLPPNATPPQGQGHVSYSVMPAPGIAAGTAVGGGKTASIVFDRNAPIETADWINTIDDGAPASQVVTLGPLQATTRFPVAWVGDDAGASGVATYDVWVAEGGGAYVPWLRARDGTSAFLTGLAGRTYAFYSVARDRVGNAEPPPAVADATTTVARLEHFTAYQAGEADERTDVLPKDCNVTLDAPVLRETENFAVSKTARLLLPAARSGEPTVDGVTHLLAHQIVPARQGIAPPQGKCSKGAANPGAACVDDVACPGGTCDQRKFVKGAKHRPRTAVKAANAFGTLFLDTSKAKYLLLPTPKGLGAPPAPGLGPTAVDHYACYAVKPTKGLSSGQAPAGKFRKGLQAVVEDQFADGSVRRCGTGSPLKAGQPCTGERTCGGQDGMTGFCQPELHPALGTARLYDLKKPTLFCTPAAKAAVDTTQTDSAGATRAAACAVTPTVVGSPTASLVCYQAVLATTVVDPAVAGHLGVAVGTRVDPAQSRHVPRAPFVATQLPHPRQVSTTKDVELCVPSDTLLAGW